MTTLVVTNEIDPVVGLALSSLAEAGEGVFTYHLTENRFMGSNTPMVPPWLNSPSDYEYKRWFLRMLEESGIDRILAIGFETVQGVVEFNAELPVYAMFRPGELDISRRRRRRQARFREMTSRCSALILLNQWEMYKATSLGSKVPHFVWDLNAETIGSSIRLAQGRPNIAVFYDHSKRGTPETLADLGFAEFEFADGSVYELLPSNSLFWYTDLEQGRDLKSTLKLRAKDFTDVIFVDSDAGSLVAMALLESENPRAIWATHTVAHELSAYGRNAPICIGSLVAIQSHFSRETSSETDSLKIRDGADEFSGRILLEIFGIAEMADLPWFFEDFGEPEFANLFFSVAALEDRSNGARPQRIRNMFLAMSRDCTTIHLSFNPYVLDRRPRLIRHMSAEGTKFQYFYGENSTNPIFDIEGPLVLTRLLDYLAHRHNLKSIYFVRDVHWLDPQIQSKRRLDPETVRYGQFELERVAGSVGGLIAPSYESAAHYRDLAEAHFDLDFIDGELPPAVSFANVAPAFGPDVQDARVSFVYTGGVSDLYSMDAYLSALSVLFSRYPGKFCADFIVRKDELTRLTAWLEEYGLESLPDIRISTESFDNFVSRTTRNIGILLLDSTYGRNAFAFKSVSYIERGMPFLVYADSPNYRYFEKYGAAIPVEGQESLEAVLESCLQYDPDSVDWRRLVLRESWDERWRNAKELARLKKREIR